jgi:hypothetical protein
MNSPRSTRVKGVVRANDPRARKQPCPLRVFSFDELHAFAVTEGTAWLAEKQHQAAGYVPVVQALVRMFSDRAYGSVDVRLQPRCR